jgi:membrane protease YdiL (CAAX protease family)
LFSAFHAAPNVIAIVNLFIGALFLAAYYTREGSLWGVCGWHSAWNWSMMHGLGLTVSGHEPTGGVLFDLQTTGHPILTGVNTARRGVS